MTYRINSVRVAEEAWRVGGEIAETMWRLNDLDYRPLVTDSDDERSVFGFLSKALNAVMIQLGVKPHHRPRAQDAVLNGYRFKTAVEMAERGEW